MVRLQDDFYTAVNEEWLKSIKIPTDRPRIGSFDEIAIKIEQQELHDFKGMLISQPEGMLGEFIKYYRMASDWENRAQLGAQPLVPVLKKIEELNSLKDLQAKLVEFEYLGIDNLLPLYVEQDMKNTSQNILNFGSFSLILPDTTYYTKDNSDAQKLITAFKDSTVKLLTMVGYRQLEAEQIVAAVITLDKQVAQFVLSNEEKSDYWKLYNPMEFSKFSEQIKFLDINAYLKELAVAPTIVNVSDLKFWQNYNEIVNEDNFAALKATLIVETVQNFAKYLSNEIRIQASEYSRILSGTKEAQVTDKAALNLAKSPFSPVVGDYYGRKYFGQAAKDDVLKMVKKMITVYENRLSNNTWLSNDTKAKAKLKLSKIGLNVGFPDKIPDRYQQKIVNEKKSILENALKFIKIEVKHHWNQLGKTPDKTEWEMPADLVNAYYHPFHNIIVFPAAILQAPFYNLKQATSANYGGIGAVIAHEISHAFDTNGARFDENGNLNSWWSSADFKAFEQRSAAMVQEFDGLTSGGAKINGHLVVSENVADVGGLSAALEAAKTEADVDLKVFFNNWATIWRNKASVDFLKLMASIDVHAPAPLRANVQVTNFAEFFEVFGITENDKMWRKPTDRVQIW